MEETIELMPVLDCIEQTKKEAAPENRRYAQSNLMKFMIFFLFVCLFGSSVQVLMKEFSLY